MKHVDIICQKTHEKEQSYKNFYLNFAEKKKTLNISSV